MKFKSVLFLFFLIIVTSCTKKSILETTFDCRSSTTFTKTKVVKDVQKNFKITIPTNWKTQLYFDEYQSDVFTADTVKQLTQTYILDTSWKMGELVLNKEFESKIKEQSEFEITNFKFENILNKPAFWYLSKGKKKNYDYYLLKIYLKTAVDSYLEITTEIYGNKNINERLCESLSLIKTIKFI